MEKIKVAYIHNHTIASIQDGIAKIEDYALRIKEMNEQSSKYEIVAMNISEHGQIYKIGHCSKVLKSKEIQHIPGCEMYHTETPEENIHGKRAKCYHLVIIPTPQGKQNFINLISYAGFHKCKGAKDIARADDSAFEKFGKGLIATTACLGGFIPTLILDGKYEEAKEKALYWNSIFDQLYLEIQPHDNVDQHLVNASLVRMSQETGLPLIVGTDAHYVYRDDYVYANMFKAISRHNKKTDNNDEDNKEKVVTDKKKKKGKSKKEEELADDLIQGAVDELTEKEDTTQEENYYKIPDFFNYLKSFEEIEEFCITNNIPLECISNTKNIADMCNTDLEPKDEKAFMPKYPIPKGYSEESYLTKISREKLMQLCTDRNLQDIGIRLKRLDEELSVINKAKFAGYFLIVAKWIEWCRQNNIPTGPGRGSAASSICNYALGVTSVDPIKYKFLFSRFLSEARLEMPDK